MAYHDGNAAKIAATATTSHTSFPSQMGPIGVDGDPTLDVVLPDERVQHPHAKVEPLQDEEPHPRRWR